jgi:DNA-binding NarL/FixJ family response regulator
MISRFAGSAGVLHNAAYYLQHGQAEDSLKEQMRLAFDGNAGVPPAAAKQMKKSKSQSK